MARLALFWLALAVGTAPAVAQQRLELPQPDRTGSVPFETLLERRLSIRSFADDSLDLGDAAQLLWAGLGRAQVSGHRTVPSAGGLYPLDLYLVAGRVRVVDQGVYRYDHATHALILLSTEDVRVPLAQAALRQAWVAEAPAVLVVAAVYERTTGKYGDRGIRYAHMEVGLVAQNIYLEAGARGLGTTFVGAFDDEGVAAVLGLAEDVHPLALLPVGMPGDP